MFKVNYNFFDYKGVIRNTAGYTGQDYGGLAQYLYIGISVVLIIILLILLRKSSRKTVLNIIRVVTIFLIVLIVVKTAWETYYDIKFDGHFNTGLLPFDMCSMIMFAGLFAGFGKGKLKKAGEAWLATGSIVGGIATMFFLYAFKYYPFFSFGAFYSMIWHFLMVFLGLLLIVTKYVDIKYSTIYYAFLFHLAYSIIVIPVDFIYKWDFMMFRELGGIPFFEGIATTLTNNNLQFLNPILMLLLYLLSFHIVFMPAIIIKKLKHK